MLHNLFSEMYEIPIAYMCVIIVIIVAVWTFCSTASHNKIWWHITNLCVLILGILLVLTMTLVARNKEPQISFRLFEILMVAKQHRDVYSQMLLNVILFLPIGLSMPFAIEKVVKRPVLMTVIFSTAFSVAIEILQYIFAKGYSEIDDVWLNTLGAVAGAMSYLISKYLARLFKGRNKVG